MASVKEATILLLLMMFTINMGLIAINESGTGIPIFAGDSNTTGFDSIFTMDDIQSSYISLEPINKPDTDPPCSVFETGVLCVVKGVTSFLAGALDFTTFLINAFFTMFLFLIRIINALLFSWLDALSFLADKLEPEGGSIQLLFTTVKALIFIIIVVGISQFIRDARR